MWPSRRPGIAHVLYGVGVDRVQGVLVGEYDGCVEGGSLGVFCKRRVAGVFGWDFAWEGTMCDLGSGHGGFMG